MNILALSVVKFGGILFVGMKWFKTTVPGTVIFAEHAEIGENGIVRFVIGVLMALLCRVNIVIILRIY